MLIFYQNINGLCTKTEEFKKNVEQKDYDVILLTETRLNDDITQGELFPSDYQVYRRERDEREGGGVLIAIKKDRNFNKRKWDTFECEDLWITVTYRNYKIHICCAYLVPACPLDDFHAFIENVSQRMNSNKSDRFLIVGDFNMPEFRDSNRIANNGSKLRTLQDFMHSFDMRQFNRGRNANDRTLDLVLCNKIVSVIKARGLVFEDEHHPAIQITL